MFIDQKHIFITGTDTHVGKSIFTAILAQSYFYEGKKVAISKPIATSIPNDLDLLAELTGNKILVFNTYNFSLGAAPIVAAREENKIIDIERIISDIRKLEGEFDYVIVEGVGGIAVPITDNVIARSKATKQSDAFKHRPERKRGISLAQIDPSLFHSLGQHSVLDYFVGTNVPPRNDIYLVADLIKDLNYPIIIVARPTLGTINHTVLTIEFAKQKGLNILGFVISGYEENTNDPVIRTAPDEISRISGVKCLMKIPLIKKLNYESILETLHATSLK